MDERRLILLPGEKPARPVVTGRVSVTRSYSYKMNLGNYESQDFFCSQNVTCDADKADEVGDAVYQWCKRQVLANVAQYRAEQDAAIKADRDLVNERKAQLQRARLDSVRRTEAAQ